jgi:alpha-glucosidase
MKELGVSVSPNVKPGVLTTHPLYEELSEFKSFVKDP